MLSPVLFHHDMTLAGMCSERHMAHGWLPGNDPFIRLDWPSPDISTALLGPFHPSVFDGKLHRFVCLAVDASGKNIAAYRFQKRADNLDSIWPYLDQVLTQGSKTPPAPDDGRLLADDCPFSLYSDADFWLSLRQTGDPVHPAVRHAAKQLALQECGTAHPTDPELGMAFEQKAKAQLTHQLQEQIEAWLASVSSELRDTLIQRPELSPQVITTLLRVAQNHGARAYPFVIQALRTEPLGLLALMADEYRQEGQLLLTALLAGSSIQATLSKLGVSPRAHRLLLKHDHMRLSGPAWLAMARQFDASHIECKEHVRVFWDGAKTLSAIGVKRYTTAASALAWCCEKGGKSLRGRFNRLARRAHEFKDAFSNRAEAGPETDELIGWLTAMPGASLGDMNCLDDQHFAKWPEVPADLALPSGWTLGVLNSWVKILDHGAEQGNCLSHIQHAVDYLQGGSVLFGLRADGKARATIAIRPFTRRPPEFRVHDMDCNDHALLSDAYWHDALDQLEDFCSSQNTANITANDLVKSITQRCQYLQKKCSPRLADFADALVAACNQQTQKLSSPTP